MEFVKMKGRAFFLREIIKRYNIFVGLFVKIYFSKTNWTEKLKLPWQCRFKS